MNDILDITTAIHSTPVINQPRFNVGLLGHVAHGKSTTVGAFTGIETFKFSREKERGITMKIGYANCKIFRCVQCPEPQCYVATGSDTSVSTPHTCTLCGSAMNLVEFFSFVDCPGHESLMNTMLSGATVMDYAILLIDGSQKCPQPQTREHLAALEILQVKRIIVLQNKLDIIDGNQASAHYDSIVEFLRGTIAHNAPIIPFSAQKRFNLDIVCEYICKYFVNTDKANTRTKMNIIRSFDVNKPGCDISTMVGGVLGGSLISGRLNVGDVVEIRPGIVQGDSWQPLTSRITSIKSDRDSLNSVTSGGLLGICTNLDPALTRSDRMVGQVLGLVGAMPTVYTQISCHCKFMEASPDIKYPKLKPGTKLLLNIASNTVEATIVGVKRSTCVFKLEHPCCIDKDEIFSLSCYIRTGWRLMGMAAMID